MSVVFLTFLSVILYSLFAIFLSKMGGKINPNLGAAIFTGLGAIIPLVYFLWERASKNIQTAAFSGAGLTYAILAGLAIAAWNVIVIVIFARGGNTSYVFPITYGLGAIAIPSIISWLFFKEVIGPWQGVGLAMVIIGIALIAFSRPS